jgi:hypothetical protein
MANIHLLHWLISSFIGDCKLRVYFLSFYKADLENDCFLGPQRSPILLGAHEYYLFPFSVDSSSEAEERICGFRLYL